MKEAEAALFEALANTLNQAEGICAGLILHNLAVTMLGGGWPPPNVRRMSIERTREKLSAE